LSGVCVVISIVAQWIQAGSIRGRIRLTQVDVADATLDALVLDGTLLDDKTADEVAVASRMLLEAEDETAGGTPTRQSPTC
jgi:hypothetical protein